MASCRAPLNDLLSYSTLRTVRIRDWRLGALHLSLLLAIFAYVCIYTLVFEQRYRKLGLDIAGSTRLSLRPPAPAYARQPALLPYCGAGNATSPSGFVFSQAPCRFLDQYEAVVPFLEPSALFMATRVTETDFALPADCADFPLPSCNYTAIPGETSFFVGNVELFTLLLDHAISSSSLGIALAATQMPGRIVDTTGAVLSPCDDYTELGFACDPAVKIGRVGVGAAAADIFPLRTLLRAAGIASLDDQAGALPETRRWAGLILIVSIEYSNFYLTTGSWNEAAVQYTYSV